MDITDRVRDACGSLSVLATVGLIFRHRRHGGALINPFIRDVLGYNNG